MLSHYLKEVIELVFWYINFETISFNLDNMGQKQFLCDDTIYHFTEMLIFINRKNKLWPYNQIIGDDSFDDLNSSLCIREWHQKVNKLRLGKVLKFDVFDYSKISKYSCFFLWVFKSFNVIIVDFVSISSTLKACLEINHVFTLICLHNQLKGFRLVCCIVLNVSHNHAFDCTYFKISNLSTQVKLVYLKWISKFTIRVNDIK